MCLTVDFNDEISVKYYFIYRDIIWEEFYVDLKKFEENALVVLRSYGAIFLEGQRAKNPVLQSG